MLLGGSDRAAHGTERNEMTAWRTLRRDYLLPRRHMSAAIRAKHTRSWSHRRGVRHSNSARHTKRARSVRKCWDSQNAKRGSLISRGTPSCSPNRKRTTLHSRFGQPHSHSALGIKTEHRYLFRWGVACELIRKLLVSRPRTSADYLELR
jgi:hypothetical protein